MRVKFSKGRQREFLKRVVSNANCTSLRRIKQFGIEVNYQTMKAYYNETRNLPESLFLDLCKLANINPSSMRVKMIDENWGQVKGGKR